MTKREDDDELDLDLDLEFEEYVGEPRPMSDPARKDAGDESASEAGAGETARGDDEALELAGDLLADTGEELLASLSESDEAPPTETGPIELAGDVVGAGAGPDLELEVEESPAEPSSTPSPATTAATAPATAAASTSEPAAGDGAELEGQWVWQFAAPPPPAPFSSVFFSGRAHAELYWFFASGLLVLLGCLLPWGPSLAWVVEQGESTLGYTSPPAGYELPSGAICLGLAVWLLGAASYGIYTGRQRILPVFMMLLPAWVSWSRTLSAWGELGAVDGLGFKDSLMRLFEVAGTGVLLTMVGSTIVAAQLLVVILKVMRKQPAAEGAHSRKGGDRSKSADEPGKGRGRDKQGGAQDKTTKREKKPKKAKKDKRKSGGDDASRDGAGEDAAAEAAGDEAGGKKTARGRRGRGR